jgi:predicted  nucleic acid-binding Zn-ribbon protein
VKELNAPQTGIENRLTDPEAEKVRIRKQMSQLSSTLRSQMSQAKEHRELLKSAEKERDLQFVAEVNEANR